MLGQLEKIRIEKEVKPKPVLKSKKTKNIDNIDNTETQKNDTWDNIMENKNKEEF